jgi:hypothetical protein
MLMPTPQIRLHMPSNAELMSICHNFVVQLQNGMAPWVVQRLNNTYGPAAGGAGHVLILDVPCAPDRRAREGEAAANLLTMAEVTPGGALD